IQRLRVSISAFDKGLPKAAGGIRWLSSSALIRAHTSLLSREPGDNGVRPLRTARASSFRSRRIPAVRLASSGWGEGEQVVAWMWRTSRLNSTLAAGAGAAGRGAGSSAAVGAGMETSRAIRRQAAPVVAVRIGAGPRGARQADVGQAGSVYHDGGGEV